MPDSSFLDWPFLDDGHRKLAADFGAFVETNLAKYEGQRNDTDVTREIWRSLGQGGWLKHCFPTQSGNEQPKLDLRAVALFRERLAYCSGIADVALSEPWLGGLPIVLFGTPDQLTALHDPILRGTSIPAFALSEPDAGSDVAAIATTARRDGDGYVIDGTKTWTSNAGVADFYVVFAKEAGSVASKSLSAFVVPGDAPGISLVEHISVLPPHSVGTLRFEGCRIPSSSILGAPGQGFSIAMRALELFRPTVGAATLGFARRALDEAVGRAQDRTAFGRAICEHQLVQKKIAEMAYKIDISALLVYRACWLHDVGDRGITRESAMAKLYSTESAQEVIDEAVQIFGGLGVVEGVPVERLYREIRAFRIFDGASDIQKLIIAKHILRNDRNAAARNLDHA